MSVKISSGTSHNKSSVVAQQDINRVLFPEEPYSAQEVPIQDVLADTEVFAFLDDQITMLDRAIMTHQDNRPWSSSSSSSTASTRSVFSDSSAHEVPSPAYPLSE